MKKFRCEESKMTHWVLFSAFFSKCTWITYVQRTISQGAQLCFDFTFLLYFFLFTWGRWLNLSYTIIHHKTQYNPFVYNMFLRPVTLLLCAHCSLCVVNEYSFHVSFLYLLFSRDANIWHCEYISSEYGYTLYIHNPYTEFVRNRNNAGEHLFFAVCIFIVFWKVISQWT